MEVNDDASDTVTTTTPVVTAAEIDKVVDEEKENAAVKEAQEKCLEELARKFPLPPPPPSSSSGYDGGDEGANGNVGKTENGIKTAGESSSMSLTEKRLFADEMKFMKDFDPNQRLIKKKMKKFTESGIVVDRCDCLIPDCPGCHYFPCKSCGSHKCGHVCRIGRRWDYEELEIQGNPSVQKRTRSDAK